MSGAARDGWAIKGPDGVLYPMTFSCSRRMELFRVPQVVWNGILEDCRGLSTLPKMKRTAKRLGYSLVPVRLVEIDDEKEGCDGK